MDENVLVNKLEEMFAAKNKVPLNEFIKFKPLFTYDDSKTPEEVMANMTPAQIENLTILGDEWAHRVSLYSPVEIIDTSTGKTLITLPPRLTRITPLNEIDGVDTDTVVNTFNNAFDRTSPGRDLASPQVLRLREIMKYADSSEDMLATIDTAVEMSRIATGAQPAKDKVHKDAIDKDAWS